MTGSGDERRRATGQRGPGYLWRPGSSRQDDPLHLVVAVVIGAVVLGSVLAAILVGR